MSEIRVTKERIDHLMGTAEKQAMVCYAKHMILIAKLENGFVIETSSGCVDPKNFDEEIGEKICTKKLEDKIWELEGYALQKQEYEKKMNMMSGTDFGWALHKMRHGFAVRRRGWNGKGIFIKMQVPDEHSKMTSPYIYIDTTGLQTDNAFAPRSCVPWLASQTDMLAEDWEVAE